MNIKIIFNIYRFLNSHWESTWAKWIEYGDNCEQQNFY